VDAILALQAKLGIGGDAPGVAVEALMSNGACASLWRAFTGAEVANVVRTDLAVVQTIISDLLINKGNPVIDLIDTVRPPAISPAYRQSEPRAHSAYNPRSRNHLRSILARTQPASMSEKQKPAHSAGLSLPSLLACRYSPLSLS